MYKIKIGDLDLARNHGVKIAKLKHIWVNIEIGQYVDKENATIFKTLEDAEGRTMKWETIVKIDN